MRAIEFLGEGELIDFPERVLIVPASAYDFYQLSKMLANPYNAHKIKYEFASSGNYPGKNANQVVVSFQDDVSFEQAKKVFKHFKIEFTEQEDHPTHQNNNVKKPYKDEITHNHELDALTEIPDQR